MLTALILLAAATPGQSADPLAEARAGKIQCVAPNREKKTCMGMASFTVRRDGSYDSVVTMMIVPTPLITMEVRNSGKVEGDGVCAVVHKADFANAKLSMQGGAVNAAMEQAIKAQMLGAVEPMDGKNACSIDKPEGDLFLSTVTLDGVAKPELTQKFIWVKADEGYTIGQ